VPQLPGGTACEQAGCGGVIEDGFCDECGMAPRAVTTNGADPGSGTPSGTASGTGTASGASGTGTASGTASGTAAYSPTASGTAAHIPTASGAGPGTAAYLPDPTGASGSAGRWSTGSRGTRPGRRTTSGRTSSGRGRGQLGAGLVEVPPVAVADPSSVLLTDPQVPERNRFCGACGGAVGRGRDDRPGRVRGFCPSDGTPFDFEPALKPGDLVAGQYEVRGCLAHGGLGWIYLAVDRNVHDRWVVLKGLLNSGDADAVAAAVAERRFLAEVNHPSIVKIYNFVHHEDAGGTDGGYIVMEYVGGSSLKELLSERRAADGSYDPIPVPRAIAYALEVLSALGYLHAHGLVYCDFKPENAIQYERQLKLIDLGAVLRMDDEHSPVFGTVGYQAPEVRREGPSAASDVHTVGRSLAVLALGMPPQRAGKPNPLPDRHPVFDAHPSFHRLLLRAVDEDPLRRFETCEEMADQLEGVLREVLSADDGQPRPARSVHFSAPRGTFAPSLLLDGGQPGRPDPLRLVDALPVPLVHPADPDAGLLATLGTDELAAVTRAVAAATRPGPELRLRLVRAHLDAGDPAGAAEALRAVRADLAGDWRLDWYAGVAALLDERTDEAAERFAVVYATLPGEAAPKLALAATAEAGGRDDYAGPLYTLIARPDPGLADAAFGRARVALRAGDRDAALAALDAVPDTSIMYVPSRLAAVTAQLHGRHTDGPGALTRTELAGAVHRIDGLELDDATRYRVRARLLGAAIDLGDQPGGSLLGVPWREHPLRLALERCLRGSARLATERGERIALVDRANAMRPRTWT
jgi:serine/threonine-protein kinase PknG